MRIKNVQLENYLGIQEGTARNELLIDFEPGYLAGLQRYMLFGRNGSGKSTTINAMSPFPTQGDGRSEVIIPGRAGRKIITFQSGEREIKCDIRWSKGGKTSCFMYIDGHDQPLDITAKGNITEYLKAVEQELGVTPDFLKIGRMGTRVTGFLDLGPVERKNYIGRFMPEVEEWSIMHKNVSKRVTGMKNELKGLQVEIDRIEAREVLEQTTTRAQADLSRLHEDLRRIDTAIGSAQGALDEMVPLRLSIIQRFPDLDANAVEFNPIASAIYAAEQEATRAKNRITRLITERPRLEAFSDINLAREKVASLNTSIATKNGEMNIVRANRSSTRARLDTLIKAEKNAQLAMQRANNASNTLEALKLQRDEMNAKVDALREQTMGMKPVPMDVTYEQVKNASDAVMTLRSNISDLVNAFPNPEMLRQAIDCGMDAQVLRQKAAAEVAKVRELRGRIDILKSRVATIEAQSSFYARFSGMHCSDAKCPYERMLSQMASAGQEADDMKHQIDALEKRIATAEEASRDYQSAAAGATTVNSTYAGLRQHRAALEAAGVWMSIANTSAFYTLLQNTAVEIEQILSVGDLLSRVAAFRDLHEHTQNLESVSERIESVESAKDAKEQLEEVYNASVVAREEAEAEMVGIDEAASAGEQTLKSLEQAKNLIQQLIDCNDAMEAANSRVASLIGARDELDAMRVRWERAQADIVSAKDSRASIVLSISQADATLADARLRLGRRDEFEKRLAEMQGRLERAEAVAAACHPAKGAPIEFLRDFLDSTRDTVNSLLDIALRGEFRIGFSLSDSEFRIPVAKGSGRVIPDVTEASEGQIALAKTVLSLALVKQTVQSQGGYNVICLDEIDGMLDRERNRERFAEIVDRLSLELGLEQLMLISHNDNFAAAPAGLILFPGHAMPVDDESFLSNKLIIADFS